MASRRSKVLIVDDEDNIVLALHRVLYQDNHRYDVLLARTAEIAQQILLDIPVDVLVTDVHLPEKSGMDLLCWAAVETPTTRVIVMTAFDVTGIKDRAHAFGCLRLMRKPFDVHEMRATILKALDRRDSFTGNLSELSAIDVIQMLCIARKTTSLRLSENQSSGVILIENGEIVHAIWDKLVGEDAFFAMMSVKNGLFYTSQLPPDIERTIKGDWQYLLIEGLRRLDEANAGILPEDESPAQSVEFAPVNLSAGQNLDRGPSKAASSVPPAAPSNAGGPPSAPQRNTEVSRLIDQGFAALRSGKREDARKFWEEALKLEPTNRMIELNLRKLEAKNLRDQR
jgi:DNA-binding NarL/FixJ family response regulator